MGAVIADAAALGGLITRIALACVFALAALHAARDWATFRAAVAGYRIGPARLAELAGWALPPSQFAVAVALLAPASARGACAASIALLAVFAGAMAANIARGRRDIDCGCGGADGQRLSWALVGRNAVLAAMLGGACAAPRDAAVGVADGAVALAAAVVMVTLYFMINQLVANRDALADWRSAA